MLTALFRISSRRLASQSLAKREFATTPVSRAKEELDDLFLPLVGGSALHVLTLRFED